VDPALTGISVDYGSGGFIGDRIFRTSTSDKYTGRYFVYSQGQAHGDDTTWLQGTDRPVIGFDIETETYTINEHAPTDYITDRDRSDADPPLQLETDTTNNLTKQLLVEYELAVVTKATTAANFNASSQSQLSGTSQWSDLDNSDPIDDILTGIQVVALQTGVSPADMGIAMDHTTWTYLCQHPTILDFFKRQGVSLGTASGLSGLFDVQEVLVGGAVYNSAVKGQTVTQAFIWESVAECCLIYAIPPGGSPGLKTMQFGVSFRVNQQGGGTRVVERWREDKKRADYISVVDSWDIQFTAQDASNLSIGGYLIYDTVA
jgi:hypothetical protein